VFYQSLVTFTLACVLGSAIGRREKTGDRRGHGVEQSRQGHGLCAVGKGIVSTHVERSAVYLRLPHPTPKHAR